MPRATGFHSFERQVFGEGAFFYSSFNGRKGVKLKKKKITLVHATTSRCTGFVFIRGYKEGHKRCSKKEEKDEDFRCIKIKPFEVHRDTNPK